ncbi:preprotein translocase subunit SecE [Capnocytophaga sp. oral taxon 878]|uniref:preprotein translocase subunit SecE n=1 Tax=Capnocytophaga sp. oral taxon 878 TaxID=1316596 RepID=UPI000D026392|nr:preprotein translocase subunit SecE [Capnocytophaga sp. oral taxon 878]AVM50491.1 preprotein translocase subunit SecE [Capnocytophaga sp. oral taxon 878]
MVQYIKESYEELKNHVTWPTLASSQKEMVVVVVFAVLFSLVIWGMDSSFEYLIGKYFKFMQ